MELLSRLGGSRFVPLFSFSCCCDSCSSTVTVTCISNFPISLGTLFGLSVAYQLPRLLKAYIHPLLLFLCLFVFSSITSSCYASTSVIQIYQPSFSNNSSIRPASVPPDASRVLSWSFLSYSACPNVAFAFSCTG